MTLAVERIVTGPWQQNCYLAYDDGRRACVIDPGGDSAAILARIRDLELEVAAILCTHAHFDHMGAVSEMQTTFGAPFYLHSADAKLLSHANLYRKLVGAAGTVAIPKIDVDLASLSTLTAGTIEVAVLPCPGHTPGGVAFLISGNLFSGDSLMRDTAGRTDLPGSDARLLTASLQRLFSLPPDTVVHPGHGAAFRLGDLDEASRGSMGST